MNSRRLMSNNSTPLSGRGLLHCAISTSPLSQMGHELPRHLAERAAVMPPKAAAPSRDQGGRGGPLATWRILTAPDADCPARSFMTNHASVSSTHQEAGKRRSGDISNCIAGLAEALSRDAEFGTSRRSPAFLLVRER